MAKERLTFKELDAIIDEYKEDRLQKRALLILKSDCDAFRGEGIPLEAAQKIVENRGDSTEILAIDFKNDGDDKMYDALYEKAEKIRNVLHICYEEEEE